MIFDQLKNAKLYNRLNPRIAWALEYLATRDFSTMKDDRHEIDGDNLFALVQRYESKPRDQTLWEAHQRYIDVQYIADGIETMGYTHIEGLKQIQAYSREKDVLKLDGEGDFLTARTGCFAIFYPEDAHMPGLAYKKPVPVVKVVVKVLAS